MSQNFFKTNYVLFIESLSKILSLFMNFLKIICLQSGITKITSLPLSQSFSRSFIISRYIFIKQQKK